MIDIQENYSGFFVTLKKANCNLLERYKKGKLQLSLNLTAIYWCILVFPTPPAPREMGMNGRVLFNTLGLILIFNIPRVMELNKRYCLTPPAVGLKGYFFNSLYMLC